MFSQVIVNVLECIFCEQTFLYVLVCMICFVLFVFYVQGVCLYGVCKMLLDRFLDHTADGCR